MVRSNTDIGELSFCPGKSVCVDAWFRLVLLCLYLCHVLYSKNCFV